VTTKEARTLKFADAEFDRDDDILAKPALEAWLNVREL